MTAPAAMPSEEEIARAIAQADEQNGGAPYEQILAMGKHAREPLFDRARAILALFEKLFAQILAEKGRAETNLDAIRSDAADLRALLVEANGKRLAAEAALAAERERCAKIAEAWRGAAVMTPAGAMFGANTPNAIAAAIRAQGE